LGAVAGWYTLMRSRVFNVFNAVTAQNRAPMCFGVGIVLVQYVFVSGKRFVEIIQPPKIVCTVK
jgi:hypothetical protein